MDGETGNPVTRLSMFLPPDVRHEILEILLKNYDKKNFAPQNFCVAERRSLSDICQSDEVALPHAQSEPKGSDSGEKKLAKELGCTLTSLRGWENNGSVPDEYMPKILVLALQNCPETRDLLMDVSNELNRLCKNLTISGNEETNFNRFMTSLDERSREIIWHLLRNRHANIRELANLIYASTDQDVLTRIRDVINPRAKEIFGKPMLNFNESRIDPFTGDKILFSWWLSDDLPLEGMTYAFDIFDEKDHLVVITEVPGVREEDIRIDMGGDMLRISAGKYLNKIPLFYPVENSVKSTYNNGVLEIRLKKRW